MYLFVRRRIQQEEDHLPGTALILLELPGGGVHAPGGVLEKKKIGTQTPDQVMGLTIVPWQERILKAMRDSSL